MSPKTNPSDRVFSDEELRVEELGIKNNLKQCEVHALIEYYNRNDPQNNGLLPEQFKEAAGEFISSGLTVDPNLLFNIFDTAEAGVQGRVTMREFILGYAILCRGTTENRLRYLFAIYGGPEETAFLTRDQLISSLKLMQRIVSQVSDGSQDTDEDDSDEHVAEVADTLIAESSNPQSNAISYDDFIDKIKESDIVMSWLENLSTVAEEHFRYIEKLELKVVELNMERQGILSQGSTTDLSSLQQPQKRLPSASRLSDSTVSSAIPIIGKKSRIPMPRKQKVVRRDLRSYRSTSEPEIGRSPDDLDDSEINAAKPFLIHYDQIQFGKILGRGACATVYQGTWMHIPVAIKVFNDGQGDAANPEGLSSKDEELRKAAVGDYVEEFWLLLQIRHPNCLLYMGICFEPVVCIVTELFTGGSVANFLHGPNERRFVPDKAIEFIRDVAQGMFYLHASSPPILHRDLKASNVLINRTVTHCVICDFGLSRQFVSEASGINVNSHNANALSHRGGGVGTPYTMAPEVMQDKPYTPAADVFSFGIVMYEIYTGRVPFPNMKPIQLMFRVCSGHRPEFFDVDNVPPTLQKLIEHCWAQDLKLRPTFGDILKVLSSTKLAEEVDAILSSVSSKNDSLGNPIESTVDEMSKLLLEEAYLGRHKEVLNLLNRGANVNFCDYDRRTALHVAAAEGQVECMRVLIRAGAQLSLDRWNNNAIVDAINFAKRSRNTEPVRLLRAMEGRNTTLSNLGELNTYSGPQDCMLLSSAMNAAVTGDISTLEQFLDDGLDVNKCDYDRRTLLMVAASEGKRDIVEMLLRHGANVHNRDRWGSTAFHEAERGGYHDVKLLLQTTGRPDETVL